MRISCDECAMQGTDHCQGCVVSFILTRDEDDAVVVDAEEARALRELERAGLVPPLGFVPRDEEAG
ncbi:MAG TPA: hypothetical protein VGB28_06040 [Actinomycetota bacterium]